MPDESKHQHGSDHHCCGGHHHGEDHAHNGSKPSQARHRFWSTQPVPQLYVEDHYGSEKLIEENSNDDAPFDANSASVESVKAEPYSLPDAFEWSETCDLTDRKVLEEVYTLLTENYVEDDDATFRFDYSMNFLRWALMPPGFHADWHIAVRVKSNKKLVGFITGIPITFLVKGKRFLAAEINFLCVHKKLRSKRLAPVLIKEITRRVNKCNIWQAVYTAGTLIPSPVATTRYYHRSLNIKKLVEVGFSSLPPRMTMSRSIKLYSLPDEPTMKSFIQMDASHVKQVHALVNSHLMQFKLHPVFVSKEETSHYFLPQNEVVYSYVCIDEGTDGGKKVIGFVSFYCLPSTILKCDPQYGHKLIKAAYLYACVAVAPLTQKDLMMNALILARDQGFDVFNCLNVMNNDEFLDALKFGPGDGCLRYYLYNWKTAPVEAKDVGLILV